MASRTIVMLSDDLDGQDADETVKFGIDGIEYEIDLRLANSNKLREMIAPYVAAGRRVGKSSNASPHRVPIPRKRDAWLDRAATASQHRAASHSTFDPQGKEERRLVREWAFSHGVLVKDRGRIAEPVYEAYRQQDPRRLPGYDPANDDSAGSGRGNGATAPVATFSGGPG